MRPPAIPPRRLLLAVDGSRCSLRAAAFARGLTASPDVEVIALLVLEPLALSALSVAGGDAPEEVEALRQRLSSRVFSAAREALGLPPGRVEEVVLEGSPAAVILDVAEQRACDAIVMGHSEHHHGASGVGHITERVLRHAHCAVVIAR